MKPQKKFAPDFFNDFSRAKPAPRSAHGSEALSYRKPSRTYFPAPSFRKTEQGAPPPGGLRTANSAQGGASDTVIPYADTASPAHCSRWNKAPGLRRTNITRDTSGKPSDARPPRLHGLSFCRRRTHASRPPFLTQTPVSTLPSTRRASFPESCVTRATAHFAGNKQEKATALCIVGRGFASPLGSSAACRQSQGVRAGALRAANSAQGGGSRLTAPAAAFSRFTRQTRARRPESSR